MAPTLGDLEQDIVEITGILAATPPSSPKYEQYQDLLIRFLELERDVLRRLVSEQVDDGTDPE